MTIERLVNGLGARRSGSATWMAKCPAHEDRSPSLAIRQGDGAKILLHCHAGCPQAAVIDALKERGLWNEQVEHNRVIVAEYNYTDEHGELLYQVVRFEPKDFRPRYSDGRGGWIWRKHRNQVLYRLPEVLEAAIVFVVEGEKDVETLRSHGFVATTNAGGAKAPWLPQYTQALRGREVIILPDRDGPGWERARVIARALLGHAAKLVLIDLEDAKDVSEWFGKGHSETEFIGMVSGVEVPQ